MRLIFTKDTELKNEIISKLKEILEKEDIIYE